MLKNEKMMVLNLIILISRIWNVTNWEQDLKKIKQTSATYKTKTENRSSKYYIGIVLKTENWFGRPKHPSNANFLPG